CTHRRHASSLYAPAPTRPPPSFPHDALPIFEHARSDTAITVVLGLGTTLGIVATALVLIPAVRASGVHLRWRPEWRHPAVLRHRSEEHTSELQSREKLVCRLLLEKKKTSGAA